MVIGAAAGLLVAPNRAYADVLASGAYAEGSVIGRALRLPETVEAATDFPVLETIEITYDVIRHHRWEAWPLGFHLVLTFGDSKEHDRRGKDIRFTAASGLDPAEDQEGRSVKSNFTAVDTLGEFSNEATTFWQQGFERANSRSPFLQPIDQLQP
jgi:hypothetical protein